MQDVPKVSVVMCVYNQELWVAEAIESALSQKTSFKFEIILVDDCSSDSTPEICSRYAKENPEKIRFYSNTENKGLVKNYYYAISLAKGEYVADLAGDDVWPNPLKLEQQAEWLDSNPDVILCHSAWKYLNENGSTCIPNGFALFHEIRTASGEDLTEALLLHTHEKWFVPLCAAMFRRKSVVTVVEEYPHLFKADWLPCEDFQLLVLLSTRGKFTYLPNTALHYRVGHPSASSDEDYCKSIIFCSRVLRLTCELSKLVAVDSKDFKKYLQFNIQYILMRAFLSRSTRLRNLSYEMLTEIGYQYKPSIKSRLTMMLMGKETIWQLAWCLRKIVKVRELKCWR